MQDSKSESSLLHLTVTDPLGVPHTVTISAYDMLGELKVSFLEFAPTSYFTECGFYLGEQRLDLFQLLVDMQVTDGATLTMRIENYNEYSVKLHAERLKSILKLPPPGVSFVIDAEEQVEEHVQLPSNIVIPTVTPEDFLPDPSKLPNPTSLLHPYKIEDDIWSPISCLHYLCFSPFNPPTGHRMLLGDISYLEAQTLEGDIVHITAQPTGFYLNATRSDPSGVLELNPEPADQPHHSKTLVELFQSLSPLFKDRFHQLIHSASDWESLRRVKAQSEVLPWVYEEQQIVLEMKLDTVMDWNEAMQQTKALPTTNFLQRIQRDKQMANVYHEFVEAAVAGARAAIAGAFQPLNPTEPKSQHAFVYNNIFFSFTCDREYRQDLSLEACASHVSVSHDIRAITFLNALDIPELHTIPTVVVDYRGYRVLCQAIFPGILNQAPEISARYGSLDDGKTIKTDPEFHSLITNMAEKLHLSPSELTDKDGQTHLIAGGYDLKGMLGSDKRKYILENARITPRDANKQGPEFALCLLRPELVEHFQQIHKKMEIDRKIEELREEKKKKFPEDQESGKLTVEEIKDVITSAPNFYFNPNVFTNAQFSSPPTSQEAQVVSLSSFLVNVQIPIVIRTLCSDENCWPRLGVSLVDVLHQFGVNVRYLGALAKAIVSPEYRFVKWQCEVTAVARSVKHVLNRYIRDTPEHLLSAVITHLLNCVFTLPKQHSEENKEGKKKRKKKTKKAVSKPNHPFLHLKSDEIWAEIVLFTQNHFDFLIPSKIEDWEAVKIPSFRTFFLREICLQTGIQLSPSALVDKFTTESISGVTQRVKVPEIRSVESRWLYDAAMRAISEKNHQLAIELLMQSAGVQENVSGAIHRDIANCYQHISGAYLTNGDVVHAVMYHHRAIVIAERALGFDHPLVAQMYANFAQIYQAAGRPDRACRHLIRGCELFALNGCEHSIDSVNCLSTLAMLYAENAMHEMAILVSCRMMEVFESVLGDMHMQVGDCCEVIAYQYKSLNDYRKAVEYEARALLIFQKNLQPEDPRIKTAQGLLEAFSKQGSEMQEDRGKETRTTNAAKTDRSAVLRQRLHLRKMQAKMNLPRGHLLASSQFLQDLTPQQIEEEKIRLLIEEIKQKNARR